MLSEVEGLVLSGVEGLTPLLGVFGYGKFLGAGGFSSADRRGKSTALLISRCIVHFGGIARFGKKPGKF
jgi:hypothetical protein